MTSGEFDRSLHVIDGEFREVHDDLRCGHPRCEVPRTSTTAIRVPTKQGLPALTPVRRSIRGPRSTDAPEIGTRPSRRYLAQTAVA